MANKIHIAIPKPCHENWETMVLADRGRFCASCQKNVYDFTKSSDRQIAEMLKYNKDTCGRFNVSQLNRDLIVPNEKNSLWLATGAAVMSFFTLGTLSSNAQSKVNIERHDVLNNLSLSASNLKIRKSVITGNIIDENLKPVSNVLIVVGNEGTENFTNEYGKFTVEYTAGDTILFNSPDYRIIKVILDGPTPNDVKMRIWQKMESTTTIGLVATITKDRTFFGRMFHSIGNWFR